MNKTAKKIYEEFGFTHGEHPDFPKNEWRDEVADHATLLGYWDWVAREVTLEKEHED
jgi:hypothetical protein